MGAGRPRERCHSPFRSFARRAPRARSTSPAREQVRSVAVAAAPSFASRSGVRIRSSRLDGGEAFDEGDEALSPARSGGARRYMDEIVDAPVLFEHDHVKTL